MKKFLIAVLLWVVFPSALLAASVKNFYGVSAEIPDGWEFRQGEQVIIFNSSEEADKGGAVIVDCLRSDSVDSAAKKLADAVGVEKEDIGHEDGGALSMEFEQDGEPVNVRVLGADGCVLMVYTYGKNPAGAAISKSIKPLK